MPTAKLWPDDELSSSAAPPIVASAAPPVCARPAQGSRPSLLSLPAAVEAAIWRGDQLGSSVNAVLASGFAALDAVLPGGGWPCGALTEVLSAQFSILEWRLLAPALRQVCQAGRSVVVVGPPKAPHVPGLRHEGIDDRQLVWIKADTPAERLWSTEQLIKSNAFGALIAWLPQIRQEQIRRLQVLSSYGEAPVFLCRPLSVASQASAAPLRVHARVGMDWELHVEILKRKGPPLAEILRLPSMPGGLTTVITPRLRHPSRLLSRETDDVVVSAPAPARRRRAIPH